MKKVYTDELIFRALGDRHRLAILSHLLENEMNAGEILAVVDVVQSTLSHHMKILTSSGLVNSRRAGKCTYYTINEEAVIFVTERLKNYLHPAPPGGEISEPEPGPEVKPEPKQKPVKAERPQQAAEHEDIATPIVYDETIKEEETEKIPEESSKHTGKGKSGNRKDKNKKGKGKDKDKNKSKSGGKKKK